MTGRLLSLAVVVTLVVAVGVSLEAVRPSGSSSPDASAAIERLDLRYPRGLFPFAPGLLATGPGNAEQANAPAAGVLCAVL